MLNEHLEQIYKGMFFRHLPVLIWCFCLCYIKVAKVAITRDTSQLSNRLLTGNIVGHRYSGGAIPLESRIFIEQNKCLRIICLFVFLLTHFLRFLKKELL